MSVKMKVNYPKVKQDSSNRVYVDFIHNDKRYRLFNGSKINCNIYPNSYPLNKRIGYAYGLVKDLTQMLQKPKVLHFL